MKKSTRQQVARETVEIVDRGRYALGDGRVVDITAVVADCLQATRHFQPNELIRLRKDVLARPAPNHPTRIEIHNETTLAGCRRLLAEVPGEAVAALNFASAKNPGGGFLNGSEAQEESLARSSALYASERCAPEFYEQHRKLTSCLYTDAMILSPGCPVFRDDEGTLLEVPYLVTFITSPAPNAGAVQKTPRDHAALPDVLARRADHVLALAAGSGYTSLVLGAWGCGVFRNEPAAVARVFADLLRGTWAGWFTRIVFAVLDTSSDEKTIAAFRSALG
jgi:uncharacterized protein (TIGR02452 family)